MVSIKKEKVKKDTAFFKVPIDIHGIWENNGANNSKVEILLNLGIEICVSIVFFL